MAKKRSSGEGSIIERPNGRWMAAATINGERVYFSGKSEGEVKEKLKKAIRESDDGVFVKNNKTTFGEWVNIWLKEYTGDIKPGSYDYYEYLCRVHVLPELGKIPLNKITIELLDKFYNQKKQAKKQRGEGVLSKKIVGDIRKIIGMVLKKAVIKRKLSFNPNDYTESIGKDKPEIEYLTPEEITDFLDKISDDYWYPAFVTALGTGLRVGELAALYRSDFDLEKGFVRVQRNIVRVNNYDGETKTKLIIQTPKTKKSVRKVPLPVDVVTVIKEFFRKQDEVKGNVIELNKDYFVFCWLDGKAVDPNYLTKHFKKLVTNLGYKNIHFHSLRHSYASMLLANGEDFRTIQDFLGHKDLSSVTAMYTHVLDELKEKTARKLDGFTSKKKTGSR